MAWEQLEAALRDQRRNEEWERKQPPESCPHDGAQLEVRGKVRNCPFGNYRWEG